MARGKLNTDTIYNNKYSGFIIYFTVLSILAFLLNDLFAKTQGVGPIYEIIRGSPAFKESWFSIITFCFGAFYGANFISLFDRMKRHQGVVILIASVIFIAVYYTHIISLRPVIFFSGLIVSVVVCYIMREKVIGKYKFPIATLLLSILVVSSVAIAFLNFALSKMSSISSSFWYFMLLIAFCYVFYKFAIYELKRSMFVVGPGRSGKTVFMIGCHEQKKKEGKIIGLPSEELRQALVDYFYKGVWPPQTPEGELLDYYFSYEYGGFFGKQITIKALDFSGKHIKKHSKEIIEYLENKSKNNKIIGKIYDILENYRKPALEPPEKIAKGIYGANKLIFIIDGAEIGGSVDQNKYINFYLEIIKIMPSKPYHVVVSKADKFYENWGTYLFSWNNVPGPESFKLTEFLINRYKLEWARQKSKFEKSGDTINLSDGKNFLSLKLDNGKKKINLTINNRGIDEFDVKTENNELKIYGLTDKDYENLKSHVKNRNIPFFKDIERYAEDVIPVAIFQVGSVGDSGKPYLTEYNEVKLFGYDKVLEVLEK